MILYYAPGSGFGHFTRALAVIHTLQISSPILLAVSSAPDMVNKVLPAHVDLHYIPHLPTGELHNWIERVMAKHSITVLYVDTFASGIHGELRHLDMTHLHTKILIARRLHKQAIAPLPNAWTHIYVVEELSHEQLALLTLATENCTILPISDPLPRPTKELQRLTQQIKTARKPNWLIVHSGPEQELQELLSYAKDSAKMEEISPQWIIISPQEPIYFSEDYIWRNLYPCFPLFPEVDRIFSGAGFNMVRQINASGTDARFLPFDRKWDDQYGRVERTYR